VTNENLSRAELEATYNRLKLELKTADYAAWSSGSDAGVTARLLADPANAHLHDLLRSELSVHLAEFEEACSRANRLHSKVQHALLAYESSPLPAAKADRAMIFAAVTKPSHADLADVLACPTKLMIFNPEPVRSGQLFHFGRLKGAFTLDLLCDDSTDSLFTRRDGCEPRLVIPARHFSLANYNLSDPGRRAAAKEYVRRKLQPFLPI